MSFYGNSFTYNGIPSELYDLRIFGFDITSTSSPSDSPAGGDVNIIEQWITRKDKPYYYGRTYSTPLEFDFTVGSFNSIPSDTRSAIEGWLIGQMNYQPLQIIQDDLMNTVFNVIFSKATNSYVGNVNYSLNLHARCDRPWGIYYPPLVTKTYNTNPILDEFTYYNGSDNSDYNHPQLVITMNNYGGNFTLFNRNDNNRQFIFTGLSANEVITIDNDKEILSSSLGYLRMGNFNKNFFRLLQGNNILNLSGNISQFTLSSVWAKKVGA